MCSGTRIGTDKACLVGGRLEVTKRGGEGAAASKSSMDTFTHEVNIKTSRMKIQIILIEGFDYSIAPLTSSRFL
jgi:hypothetical protein